MSSYSKCLDISNCSDIFHPNKPCWPLNLMKIKKVILSNGNFFLPIFSIQLIRKLMSSKFTQQNLIDLLYSYVLTTATASLGSINTQILPCFFYRLLGKMYVSTTAMAPVTFGNFWLFFMPSDIAKYLTQYLSVMILEAYFQSDGILFWRAIKNSNLLRTMLFMTMSASIINIHQNLKTDVMWFIQPVREKKSDNFQKEKPTRTKCFFDKIVPCNEHVCQHSSNCDSFVFEGIKSSLKIGIALELMNFIVENISKIQRSPKYILNAFYTMKIPAISFIMFYTASFRILTCVFNRHYKKNTKTLTTLAAFLSGSVFYIHPDLMLLSHATISTFKLLWEQFIETKRNKYEIIEKLAKIPLYRFLFILNIAYVFHLRLFYPWLCSQLIFKTTFHTSGSLSDDVALNFATSLLKPRN